MPTAQCIEETDLPELAWRDGVPRILPLSVEQAVVAEEGLTLGDTAIGYLPGVVRFSAKLNNRDRVQRHRPQHRQVERPRDLDAR